MYASGNRGGARCPTSGKHVNLQFSFNMFCVYCGKMMLCQVIKKSDFCDEAKCGMQVPGRSTPINLSGWSHCPLCDRFIHPEHNFCSNCGCATSDGSTRTFMSVRRVRVPQDQDIPVNNEELPATPKSRLDSKTPIHNDEHNSSSKSRLESKNSKEMPVQFRQGIPIAQSRFNLLTVDGDFAQTSEGGVKNTFRME